MSIRIPTALALCAALTLTACVNARQHKRDVQDPADDRLTVGTVQKEIRDGMTIVEVIEVLGSPNIVQTDELRREVWVYDKIATDVAYSRSGGTIIGLVFGSSGGALEAAAPTPVPRPRASALSP